MKRCYIILLRAAFGHLVFGHDRQAHAEKRLKIIQSVRSAARVIIQTRCDLRVYEACCGGSRGRNGSGCFSNKTCCIHAAALVNSQVRQLYNIRFSLFSSKGLEALFKTILIFLLIYFVVIVSTYWTFSFQCYYTIVLDFKPNTFKT